MMTPDKVKTIVDIIENLQDQVNLVDDKCNVVKKMCDQVMRLLLNVIEANHLLTKQDSDESPDPDAP